MWYNKNMTKLGIFGGTFDPVHNEHVKVAKIAIEKLGLDKLIIMPTFIPPHKNTAVTDGKIRLEMLKRCFDGIEKTEVSDYEITKGGTSYTYQTVEYFKQKYQCELYFLVGADMLTNFKTWKNPDRILSACTLVSVGRDGVYYGEENERKYFKENFNKDFVKLEYQGSDISSSKVRVYSSLNLDIKEYVPQKVYEYIENNQLYSGDEYTEFLKKNLTEKRLIHTANVTLTALKKAKELGLDSEKVRIASLLHDCAKYLNPLDFKHFKMPDGVPKPVEHAFLGAYVAEKILGVTDAEIIDAIRYHTSGKPEMSTLSKLVFVADMIEVGRSYDGVDYLRSLYDGDFEYCFRESLKEEYIHLINKGQEIFDATRKAYEYYIGKNL